MSLPTINEIQSLPKHTADNPMKLLVSACLAGEKCGADSSSYGEYPWIIKLIGLPNVRSYTFCPEQISFGTPRNIPDIHGGNGFDVLDHKAKVLSDKGEDWTAGMVVAAEKMLKIARQNRVDLAIMMDMSAACGSQVISDGCRLNETRKYQKGPGVCTALLIRNGFSVVSQRDYRTLKFLFDKLNAGFDATLPLMDHHETAWYKSYFHKSNA